eukprot:2709893-Rhodomonas_salina.2
MIRGTTGTGRSWFPLASDQQVRTLPGSVRVGTIASVATVANRSESQRQCSLITVQVAKIIN